ncbi:MAG: hypothetical protein AABX23_00930 [Nanoarchaeota archaeon]
MQKKSVVIILLTIFFLSFALAQNASNNASSGTSSGSTSNSGNTNIISKAYQCLQSQVDAKSQNSISLQEAIFGVLALGSNSKLVSVIESKIVTGDHWQESSNPLKDTSQAMLAYNRIGRNTDAIKSWILSKRQVATDLTWYLEIDIDNHESAQCTLSYSNEQQRTININEDMTLSGSPGSCLSIATGGFWLRVSNTCIDYNYTISCDKDFTTSTLYQRTGSSTIFVSPVAHSTSALGTTTEKINSKCLSSSSVSCDYEGTLWAALVLDKTGNSINEYLPYLSALSESNKRFLSSSFLHILTDGQDQYSELVQEQQEGKFWQAPNTPYNRYYDSALAILSLQGTNSIEESNSKTYFESITTPEGCWNNNNIRDTGFLLYAGWPRTISGSGSSGGSGSAQTCESAGFSCTSVFTCSDLEGDVLENYQCPGTRVCCSESQTVQSCSEQSGFICSSAESCSGTTVQSSDGSCCLGSCSPISQSDACVSSGGGCYPSCNENEEQVSATCSDSGNVCCKTVSSGSDSNIGVWITILVILIILIIAGILMRNKLKMMLFKSRNKSPPSPTGRGIPPGTKPPFPPFRGSVPYPRAQPRIIPSTSPPVRRPPVNKDKEMEETMAKLKEMSK